MKKILTAVVVVLVVLVAVVGVIAWEGRGPAVSHSASPWSTSCKLSFAWDPDGAQGQGSYLGTTTVFVAPTAPLAYSGTPTPTIHVAVTNGSSRVRVFSHYLGLIWTQGMIVGYFTGDFGTTWASPGERWSTYETIAAVPNVYPGEPWGRKATVPDSNSETVAWILGDDVGIPIWGDPFFEVAGVYSTDVVGVSEVVPWAHGSESAAAAQRAKTPWVDPWYENTTGSPVTCTIKSVT